MRISTAETLLRGGQALILGDPLEVAPATAGALNGTAFQWVADADSTSAGELGLLKVRELTLKAG